MRRVGLCLLILLLLTSFASAEECDLSIEIPDLVMYENKEFIIQVASENVEYFSAAILNDSLREFHIDSNTGEINFIPRTPGSHLAIISGIKDTCVTSKVIDIYVNDKPEITEKSPDGDEITTYENQPLIFNTTIKDIDTKPHEQLIEWYLDGTLEHTGLFFVYHPGFDDEGKHNLTVYVTDQTELTDSTSWIITVKNVNQAPHMVYQIPDLLMYADTTVHPYRISVFFKDPDGDPLKYSYRIQEGSIPTHGKEEFEIEFPNGDYKITNTGFTGIKQIVVTATDPGELSVDSNPFFIKSIPNVITCGDKICREETCSDCPEDCGFCAECIENWICGNWTDCVQGGNQTRTCTDLNECPNPIDRPEMIRECPYSCDDGIQNQGEYAIDCGGPCPDCVSCFDRVQNQDETDVDCGGICPPCDDLLSCVLHTDCKSGKCDENYICEPANCFDNTRNQDEEGIDCGGVCEKTCASCTDGIQNGGEEGIDCGGLCIPCQTCEDGIKNQNEIRIDCGGVCKRCTLYDFLPPQYANQIVIGMIIAAFVLLLVILYYAGILQKMINLDNNLPMMLLLSKLFVRRKVGISAKLNKLKRDLGAIDLSDSSFEKRALNTIKEFLMEYLKLAVFEKEDEFYRKLDRMVIPEISKRLIGYLYRRVIGFESSRILVSMEIIKFIDQTNKIIIELDKVI